MTWNAIHSLMGMQSTLFWGFCLQVLRKAGSPQRVNCLAPMGNMCKVSLPRTQRCFANSGSEPRTSNLSIANRRSANYAIAATSNAI